MTNDPIDVVGYVRVSTEEQATSGVSLHVQRDKIELYCKLHGLRLIGIESDEGVSAKTLNRPGVQRVFERLRGGEAQGVVIAKLDRISRSVADWDALIKEFFGDRAGRQLFSVADSIDTRTAAGRLVLNVLMSVAQWERETISERVKEAMAYVKVKGDSTGQPPYGKRRVNPDDDKDTRLEPDPREEEVLVEIFKLRIGGRSAREIADVLTRKKVPTKKQSTDPSAPLKPWQASSVLAILRRLADDPRFQDDFDVRPPAQRPAPPRGRAERAHQL